MSSTRFERLKSIGKGGFGEVFLAKDNETRRNVALKLLFRERLEGRRIRHYLSEVRTLATCDSIFLVPFIGFTVTPPYCIVTEYIANGSLDHFIRPPKHSSGPFVCRLSPTQRTKIALGIAHAISRMHSAGIIHRDLKPANILLNDQFEPRVCDFGISRTQDNSSEMTRRIGTPSFMAPEQVTESNYDEKVDVYSYSLILYEMSELKRPFKGFKIVDVLREVCDKHYRPEFSSRTPKALRRLITRCWANDAGDRPTFDRIYDAFAKGAVSFKDTEPAELQRFVKRIREQEKTRGSAQHDTTGESRSGEEEDQGEEGNAEGFGALALANYRRPGWRDAVKRACESVLPDGVRDLVSVFASFATDVDRKAQRFLLEQFAGIVRRGNAFVREFLRVDFANPEDSVEALADQWVAVYQCVFMHGARLIDNRKVGLLGHLLRARPKEMLCLFSHFALVAPDVKNPLPILNLLFSVRENVIHQSGKLLLSIFGHLVRKSQVFEAKCRLKVFSVFVDFLHSKDPETVETAYAGIVEMQIPVPALDIVAQHLRHAAMWRPAVLFLNSLERVLNPDLLIPGLAVRARESQAALLILLKLSVSRQAIRDIVRHHHWMSAAEAWPVDTFRLFLQVFSAGKKIFMDNNLFGFVLRAAVETGDSDVMDAIPLIVVQTPFTTRGLTKLSRSGFIRIYHTKAAELKRIGDLLVVVERIADVGYVEEFVAILQTLVREIGTGDFMRLLQVLMKLASYEKCAQKLREIDFLAYCQKLQANPYWKAIAADLIECLDDDIDELTVTH